MNGGNPSFRRNFIACVVVHGVLIGALVLGEAFIAHEHDATPSVVELITPADILGDSPKGDGYGRGAYAPPRTSVETSQAESLQHGSANSGVGPSENVLTPEEQLAPKQSVVKTQAPKPAPVEPGEVAVPKKGKSTKKTVTASTKPAQPSPTTHGATAKLASVKSGTNDRNGAGSADAIRQRLVKTLQAQEGGTPYGDNKPAGGGTGVSKYGHLGSPDGAENGVAGGIGKGSPFWWYYQHVHDRLYESWNQPGDALNWDKRIVTTLDIRVARDGRVIAVMLKNPSGNTLMDDSAIAAANSVPRLYPLPEGLGSEFADILVNFRLENSQG